MKKCRCCLERKPNLDFPASYTGNPSTKCQSCWDAGFQGVNNRISGTFRDYWLRKKFGIGEEDYERMLKEQNGCCAICKSPTPKGRKRGSGGEVKNFYVDHCHETGKVRGLLCNHCNRGLGLLGDDLDNLKLAVEYLSKVR
jgi:hypothetical protein